MKVEVSAQAMAVDGETKVLTFKTTKVSFRAKIVHLGQCTMAIMTVSESLYAIPK